jgi:general stress protein 26
LHSADNGASSKALQPAKESFMYPSNSASQVAELAAKLKPVRVAMFTTVDQHGHLTSQPMTSQDMDPEGGLWFYTSTHTDLWENIAARPNVNVSYAQPEESLYVSVSGTAERVVERAKIEELWNPMVAAWFPNGVDDPHLVLVRVAARTAEYWDSNASKMVQMLEIAKAAITGTTPEVDPGEHGKIKL